DLPVTVTPGTTPRLGLVRRNRAAPCRELRPAEACRPKVRTFTRAARRRLGRLREVMRLAGLRVAINVRDFVANLPRRAPLLPALTDLLADTALAASDFLVLFLLGLVGLRAMA